MDKKTMLGYINKLVTELGSVRLTNACGKYFELIYNGEEVLAVYFVGKYGYKLSSINRLGLKTIEGIYNDLYEDFGE